MEKAGEVFEKAFKAMLDELNTIGERKENIESIVILKALAPHLRLGGGR